MTKPLPHQSLEYFKHHPSCKISPDVNLSLIVINPSFTMLTAPHQPDHEEDCSDPFHYPAQTDDSTLDHFATPVVESPFTIIRLCQKPACIQLSSIHHSPAHHTTLARPDDNYTLHLRITADEGRLSQRAHIKDQLLTPPC